MKNEFIPRARSVSVQLIAGVFCVAACFAFTTSARADSQFDGGIGVDCHPGDNDPDALDVEEVASFDAASFETPESMAIDSWGNKFVSLSLTGEILKIRPNGHESAFAVLPIAAPPLTSCGPSVGIMGALAIDPHDNLYVTLNSCVATKRGVWSVAPSGATHLVASLSMSALANGIAYRDGRLYVADSEQGVIWRIRADGTEPAEIWADDPLLKPGIGHVFPGPNGVQFFANELYVANSNQATMLAIPLGHHGAAGPVRVHATGVPCDDFAFDLLGNIYCATDPFNTLLRIFPDGTSEVLLTSADGLDGPSAVVFGRSYFDRRALFVTNAAYPFFSTSHTPSLFRVDIGIPGAPRY